MPSHHMRRDLEFNPVIFGTEIRHCGFAPISLPILIPGSNKNVYPAVIEPEISVCNGPILAIIVDICLTFLVILSPKTGKYSGTVVEPRHFASKTKMSTLQRR